jgi:hypothetical protein
MEGFSFVQSLLELRNMDKYSNFSIFTKCVYVTTNRKEEEKENGNRNRGDGSRFWPVRGVKT